MTTKKTTTTKKKRPKDKKKAAKKTVRKAKPFPTREKLARSNPTLFAMLDRIDAMLCLAGGAELAAVLSALRGPDSVNNAVKGCSTSPIRHLAFPHAGYRLGIVTSFKVKNRKARLQFSNHNHFNRHIESALNVLGVPYTWD